MAIGFDLSKGAFPHLEKTLIAQRSQTTDDLVTNKIILDNQHGININSNILQYSIKFLNRT